MALGQYEQIIFEALQRLSTGPWSVPDLGRAESVINDELCGGYGPDCDTSAVLDWLRALSDADRRDLVLRLNEEWSRRESPIT
jgi:hypothetical protein